MTWKAKATNPNGYCIFDQAGKLVGEAYRRKFGWSAHRLPVFTGPSRTFRYAADVEHWLAA